MTKLMVLAVLLAACGGKSAEERGREAAEDEAKRRGEVDKNGEVPEVVKKEPDKAIDKPVDAALPEPTTPEEIDKARKQAMIDGREKDVIKYCEMMKVDDKTDPQIRLGCTLAACRVNDADKARGWSAALPKELKGIAVKTCLELKVGL